jgi:hypothetical protein
MKCYNSVEYIEGNEESSHIEDDEVMINY